MTETATEPVAPEPERPPPTNVIEAIARVTGEIGGVERLTPAERKKRGMVSGNADESGISYAFRSIDQVTAAAQPLFAKYCVVIVPDEILDREIEEVMVRDRPWHDMIARFRWKIYGPGGVQDFITAETEGQAREQADKASPKVLTQAYKNLVLRLLSIGDPSDETDGTTELRDPPGQPQGNGRRETTTVEPVADPVRDTFERVKALKGTPLADEIKEYAAQAKKALTEKALDEDREWLAEINLFIDEKGKGATPVADVAEALGATEQSGLPTVEPPPDPEGVIPPDGPGSPPEDVKPKRSRTAREMAADKESGYDGSKGE